MNDKEYAIEDSTGLAGLDPNSNGELGELLRQCCQYGKPNIWLGDYGWCAKIKLNTNRYVTGQVFNGGLSTSPELAANQVLEQIKRLKDVGKDHQ